MTQMDYEIYPQALESCIRKVYQELQIPIMVTENGIAVDDDQKRVEFIEKATDGVLSCLKDGIPVKGYLYWSLMDNFEWQKGYSMTFGLIAVDRRTQKRTPKGALHIRKCPLRRFREFVEMVGYDEFVGTTKYIGGNYNEIII